MRPSTKGFLRFWPFNSAAWAGYGLASFAGAWPYIGQVAHLNSVRTVLVSRVVYVAVGILATSLFRVFFHWQRKRSASFLESAIWAFALSCLAGITTSAFSNWARLAVGGSRLAGWAAVFGGTISAWAIFLCWCATYFSIHTYRELQTEQQNALRAEATANQAKWMALRGQLQPHFLFNALNSIRALITENPSGAQNAIVELARLLRYSLERTSLATVPLVEEIDIVRQYLAIEKIRFEDNLLSRVGVQPETARFCLPGFLLHPLVENAVKYGMQTSTMPLRVGIRSALQNGELILEVANSGNWMETHPDRIHKESESLGLQLVRQQLTHAFPGKYRFCCVAEDGWVVQRIGIAGLA